MKINIHEKPLHISSPLDSYLYKIVSEDGIQGTAEVIDLRLKDCVGVVRRHLTQCGLDPNDVVVKIMEFYPNGELNAHNLNTENMRRGVGSAVLEHVIQNARKRGAKALSVSSFSDSMQSFLTKNGFDSHGSHGHEFSKVISPQTADQ